MINAERFRGTRPPKAGRPWTAAEDRWLGLLPDEEIARRTGRTLAAVYARRQALRLPSYRDKGPRMKQKTALERRQELLQAPNPAAC
jgi:hypothetical protein